MNLIDIVALLTMSVMVNGAWYTAVTQPVMLGVGAAFASIDLDVLNVHFFDWNKLNPFSSGKSTE